MKDKYLNNEIWLLTFGGAFQRAYIYPKNIKDNTKIEFKNKVRVLIEQLVNDQYRNAVSEKDHILNIQSILNFTNGYKVNGISIPLNFGISQKLLNLYLKYQWCLGKLKIPPPHFPVDRVIQDELNKRAKELKLKPQKVISWTKITNEQDYFRVIKFAEEVKMSDDNLRNLSLAELELYLYNRR